MNIKTSVSRPNSKVCSVYYRLALTERVMIQKLAQILKGFQKPASVNVTLNEAALNVIKTTSESLDSTANCSCIISVVCRYLLQCSSQPFYIQLDPELMCTQAQPLILPHQCSGLTNNRPSYLHLYVFQFQLSLALINNQQYFVNQHSAEK